MIVQIPIRIGMPKVPFVRPCPQVEKNRSKALENITRVADIPR